MHDENTNDSANSMTTDRKGPSPAALLATASSFSIIRPTAIELAHGRLMRAPDHGAEGEGEGTILGNEGNEDKSGAAEKEGEGEGAKEGEGEKEGGENDGSGAAEKEGEGEAEKNEFLGAPEGDYTITGLPDGVTVDAEVLGALAPVAKEIGLSDVAMSKLAGVYNEKILPHLQTVVQKGIEDQVAVQGKAWDAEARLEIEGGKDAEGKAIEPAKDKDGNPVYDGKSFADVRKVAAKALDRFAGPELREFLEESKLGNHPALVRAFYGIGKAIKEDTFERGGGEAAPKTR